MLESFKGLSPLDDEHEVALVAEFANVSRAVVVATLLSALAQGILAGIGFYFVGLDSIFLLTLLSARVGNGAVRGSRSCVGAVFVVSVLFRQQSGCFDRSGDLRCGRDFNGRQFYQTICITWHIEPTPAAGVVERAGRGDGVGADWNFDWPNGRRVLANAAKDSAARTFDSRRRS